MRMGSVAKTLWCARGVTSVHGRACMCESCQRHKRVHEEMARRMSYTRGSGGDLHGSGGDGLKQIFLINDQHFHEGPEKGVAVRVCVAVRVWARPPTHADRCDRTHTIHHAQHNNSCWCPWLHAVYHIIHHHHSTSIIHDPSPTTHHPSPMAHHPS